MQFIRKVRVLCKIASARGEGWGKKKIVLYFSFSLFALVLACRARSRAVGNVSEKNEKKNIPRSVYWLIIPLLHCNISWQMTFLTKLFQKALSWSYIMGTVMGINSSNNEQVLSVLHKQHLKQHRDLFKQVFLIEGKQNVLFSAVFMSHDDKTWNLPLFEVESLSLIKANDNHFIQFHSNKVLVKYFFL